MATAVPTRRASRDPTEKALRHFVLRFSFATTASFVLCEWMGWQPSALAPVLTAVLLASLPSSPPPKVGVALVVIMAICAWLAGDTSDANRAGQVHDVCEGFFCPSLGTSEDYTQWMRQAGLRVDHCLDWTSRVSRTWEICRYRVRRSGVRWIAPFVGHDSALFLDRFDAILDAYRSGAIKYGCFIARKLPNV